MRRATALFGLLLSLALSACSMGTRLAYDNLDTLFALQLDDFVTLDAAQQSQLDVAFQAAWDWHRANELPAYAVSLRELAGLLDARNPEPAEVEAYRSRFERHGERLLAELADRTAPLLAGLSDTQVDELLAAAREKSAEAIAKQTKGSAKQRRTRLTERVERRTDDWLGSLNKAQQAAIAERVAALEARGELSPERLARESEADQQALASLLASRREAGFASRLREASLPSEGPEAAELALQRAQSRQYLGRLAATLEPQQRAHLARRLRGLAEDCEVLAAKAKAKAETTPAP